MGDALTRMTGENSNMVTGSLGKSTATGAKTHTSPKHVTETRHRNEAKDYKLVLLG